MANAASTATTLTSMYKEVYADDLKDLRPTKYILQKRIPFKSSARLGRQYHQPVMLAREAGFSWLSSGLTSAQAWYGGSGSQMTLLDAAPSVLRDAVVDGSQIIGHSYIDFEAAARAESSKYSFKQSVGVVIESLIDATQHRQECDLWYGGGGGTPGIAVSCELGILAAGQSGDTALLISDASWAAALWTACEGAVVEVKTAAATASRGTATISSVNVGTKTVTVGSGLTSCAATDRVFFRGQVAAASNVSYQMKGLIPTLYTPIGTGAAYQIFGVDTQYSKWGPTQIAVGGNMTLGSLQDGVNKIIQKGGDDTQLVFLTSPKTYSMLANDWSSLTRWDPSTSSYTMGADKLGVRHGGYSVEIVQTPFCKEGISVLTSWDAWSRIGVTDITTDIPGRKGQELFVLVTGTNNYEFQSYQHLALFGTPGFSVLYTGITNV